VKRALAVLLLGVLAYAAYVAAGIPSRATVRGLAKKNPGKTALMLQREREAEKAGRRPRHSQLWVPLSRVSRHLIHAVVAAEDPKFFGHEGVDWDAVKESLETNVRKARFARGGSTITQQLAKNLFLSTDKTIARKLRELVAAYWLERELSKRRILELYLNVIEWGDGVYGCEAAAQRYYGKPAAALDPVEAAGLAAMVPSPRRINPRVDSGRHARAQKRILWLMGRLGYVERSVGGLGAEPPPEPVVEDEEPPPFEAESPAPGDEILLPSPEAASPSAEPPSDQLSPEPSPQETPTPSPEASATPSSEPSLSSTPHPYPLPT
jgi:monofunctional biosynthetic peptidoglycan transglycosylase